MLSLAFLRQNARWLAAGFLLALSSSFGQTYFIAIFAGELRAAFGLSHGAFGGIYTAATLASAATLVWLGKAADHVRLSWLSAATLCGLAVAALAMAGVAGPLMLLGVIYGLRLFGQGMLSHLAMTAMGRWYAAQRGRAISVAALGFPAGEAAFPIIAVALMAWLGWRGTWVVAAAALLLLAIPLVVQLLRREPAPAEPADGDHAAATTVPARDWTRREVLRDPFFYGLLPGILAPSFILTGVFFHQVHLVETKGWSLAWFAGSFMGYAAAVVVTSLIVGWAVDRWSAARLLPAYLVPMALGLVVLAAVDDPLAAPAFMILAGGTAGGAITILSALWAELYGTRNLGAIRALGVAGMVFASALAPGSMGWLIDLGIGLEDQIAAMAAYAFLAAGCFVPLTRRILRPTRAPARA